MAPLVEAEPSPYESPIDRSNEASSVCDLTLYPILPPAVYCRLFPDIAAVVCRRYVTNPDPNPPLYKPVLAHRPAD